jgi:thioredoxin reductase (NADPH)
MKKIYDLIIIGSGPAGLTAGIYASRYLLNFLILGKIPGGMISEAHKICNFPTRNNITGFELTSSMVSHLKELGGEIKTEEVKEVKKEKEIFLIKTNKEEYSTKKIIIATGTEKVKLNIPGEKELLGKGVSYCATCDSGFFRNKTVAVVGGSNSALTAALLLSEYSKEVFIIYRGEKFIRPDPAWIEQVKKNKKIKVIFSSEVKEIIGKNNVEKIKIRDIKGKENEKKVEGIFIEIGSLPEKVLSSQLKLKTENNYIIVDKFQKTNIKGVFAAGDVTNNPVKQVSTACGEGTVAATSTYEELKRGK